MASSDEYDKVEEPALEQLQSLGWEYVPGTELSPDDSDERSYLSDVVLILRLEAAIKRINPWINESNLNQIIRDLTKIQTSTLMEANQSIWSSLTQYMSVIQDVGKGNKGQTVKIIDFENPSNNEFLCTNQFKIQGPIQNIIPDVILFVNGLPLAVVECKSPYITNPMESGIDQLMRYANTRNPHDDEGAVKLFHYNQMMVSTYRDSARVGTISSRMEHYLEWKDPYPLAVSDIGESPYSQQVLISGVFTPTNFLDLIQNFIVFEPDDGKTIKKMARYQQFRAVHKTIERIKTGKSRKDRGGVIWHTQGSGKSLTMVFLTIKMRRDEVLKQYKLLFITDRTQLDNQLTATFQNAQDETIYNAESVAHLKELLSKDSSDVITAMVQKFQENDEQVEFPVLNESDKILIMADEAHRTQYGTLGVAINRALPNAPKIAFTGTPLIKSMQTTSEFGTYIDTYTIEEAVKDGATIQILYEGREAQVNVTGDSLDNLFDEYFADNTEDELEAIKKKYGTRQAVLEAPQRIRRVCMDILKHYREHIQPNGFKAMIVTSSRRAAINYKQMMDELEAPESAVIISGDHNDTKDYWEYTEGKKHKQQIENFKKPLGNGDSQSNLSFLIVKDMLLTGFDAPICQVMYLDRQLKDHSLLQAIARVNRTNKNKFRGYIVDYFGLSDYLAEALDMFSNDDVEGALKDLKDELPKLKNTHTRVMQHFSGLDLDDLDECILALEDETKRQQFQIDFSKFAKQMDIIMPDASASPYISDLTKLGKISFGAKNLYRDDQLNIAGAGEKVRKLIDEHIYSTGVDPKIAPVDLLASDFKEKLKEHKSDKAQASEIEYAIRQHIKVNIDEDPEYYRSLSERLKSIISKSEEKWDTLVQLLLELRDNVETERKEGADSVGLNETEYAFYNILMKEVTEQMGDSSVDEDSHRRVIEVVKQLVKMMEEATSIVGFFAKWDEQKRVKKQIKRTIIDEPFGSTELVKAITDRFMELAKVKFK
jgi:type I restriction enzyme, R subunit